MRGYNTAFTLLTKAREAIARGYNIGFISGVIEMDGAHTSGRRASEKRGIPLGQRLIEESEALDDATLTQAARQKKKRDAKAKAQAEGGVLDPAYGNVLPPLRRITLNARMRGGASGKGALQTRSAICLAENPAAAEELARRFVAIPESILATDTGTAFSKLGKRFMGHVQVNHSQHLVGPGGEHSNNSESFTARMDRAEKGIYLNLEPKYLHEYAVETAFREDHNRMPPGAITQRLMHYATNVGLSRDFRGYTHGRHRNHEVLVTGNQWATSSGPAKGRSPISSVNGRPPR